MRYVIAILWVSRFQHYPRIVFSSMEFLNDIILNLQQYKLSSLEKPRKLFLVKQLSAFVINWSSKRFWSAAVVCGCCVRSGIEPRNILRIINYSSNAILKVTKRYFFGSRLFHSVLLWNIVFFLEPMEVYKQSFK